jgi:hypothetical protein
MVSGEERDPISPKRFAAYILDAHAKDALSPLWEMELRRVAKNLERFTEEG